MKVVTNAGPLMALGKLGMLAILYDLYGTVALPEAVYQEVVVEGMAQGYADAPLVQLEIEQAHLQVIPIQTHELPDDIAALPLDLGEKQVIYLAMRDRADLVLLDEVRAREEARIRSLIIKGTLGVLIQAHHKSLLSLSQTRTLIELIIQRDDIWIAEALCRHVLQSLEQGSGTV